VVEVAAPAPARAKAPKGAATARAARVGDEARAPARPRAPRLGRTQGPPSKGPVGPRGSLVGQLTSPPPRELCPHHQGWDPPHGRGSQATPDLPGLDDRFDSTRGFPGEGPGGVGARPWFLTSITTRDLVDAKRQRLGGAIPEVGRVPTFRTFVPQTDRRLVFRDTVSPPLEGDGHSAADRTKTASGRFPLAQRTRAGPSQDSSRGQTPVPRAPSPRHQAFACLRELQDFTNPLPSIPAGESLRKAFILHFGGLHGMDAASFTEV